MQLFHHNREPTLNEQSWFWSKGGRLLAYLLMILGTGLTFILANLLSNVVQVILLGILDKNNGLISGNGWQTTFNFMINAIWNWQALFYNNELLSSIYLNGSQFFQAHGAWLASALKWVTFAFLFWHYNVYYMLRFYNRSSKLNHNENGDDRIATPHEIGQQTFKIPDRKYSYNFPSGGLMMHKMNLRGRINQFVKQQMMPTQKALQLRKDEDVGFKIIESILFIVLVFFVTLGTILDFRKPTNVLPIYSPVRLWRGIGDVFHFLWSQVIWNVGHFIYDVEKAFVTAPLYVAAPVVILEITAVVYWLVHSYNHFSHANMVDIKRSAIDWRGIGWYLHRHLSPTHFKDKFLNWLYRLNQDKYNDEEINRGNDEDDPNAQQAIDTNERVDVKNKPEQKSAPVTEIPSDDPKRLVNNYGHVKVIPRKKDTKRAQQKRRAQLASAEHRPSNKNPVVRALFKIGMHPLKSSQYMFLNTLNLLPLDKGITGYYYVNSKLNNQLIYGITRSGKGQMLINTTIESNSRTKQQKKNLLINDSKGELSAGFYRTLKERGYRVEVLNIIQMLHSMSYNPLELVKKHAMQGDVGQASKACSDLSYTIYQSSQSAHGQNAYFYNSAANVFDASVFALLALANSEAYGKDDKYLRISDKHDPDAFDKVTISNVVQLTTQLGGSQSTEVSSDNSQNSSNQLIIFFKHLGEQTQQLRDLRDKRKAQDPHKYQDNDINPLTNIETDQLNLLDQALQKFNQSKMAGDEASGSIYSTFIEGLRIYQQPDVAKMTSMNSTNIEELGFDRLLTVQFNRAFNQQGVRADIIAPVKKNGKTTFQNLETDTSHLSTIGLAQIPIRHSIPYDHFYLRLTIQDERIDSEKHDNEFQWLVDCHKSYYGYLEVRRMKNDSRQSPKVADIDLDSDKQIAYDHYTKQKVFKKISMKVKSQPDKERFSENNIGVSALNALARGKEQSLRADQLFFLYREQPTALFLVTPPDQQELNQLCTFLINQTFNTLYSLASTITDSRKVQRPLQMILDEVGNIPAIPKLDTKASIGLSAGIEMMLVFQDRKQIEKIYQREVANIVVANCATIIYILSHDDNTIKEISNAFGNRTIKSSQLTTNPNGLNGTSKNYNLQKQSVMPVGRLRHLDIGEMAVVRTTDRSNVWGKNVRPNPIFNTRWGHQNFLMPYAFWFLGNEIQSNVSLSNIPVVTPHKYLDLNDLTINFGSLYTQMEAKNTMDGSNFSKIYSRIMKAVQERTEGNALKKAKKDLAQANQNTDLGQVLAVRDEYLKPQDNKRSGEETQYINEMVAVLDSVSTGKGSISDILANLSQDEPDESDDDILSDNINALQMVTRSAFDDETFREVKDIDYYHLKVADIRRLLRVIDILDHTVHDKDDRTDGLDKIIDTTLSRVNGNFNEYLASLGIIHLQGGAYQITDAGLDFIQHFDAYLEDYSKQVIPNSHNRDKINSFVSRIVQIIRAFYCTDYRDLNDPDLIKLRDWMGLFIFQQFIDDEEIGKFLAHDDRYISTLVIIKNIIGVLDNMYLAYQAPDDQESLYIKRHTISQSITTLMNALLRTDYVFKENFIDDNGEKGDRNDESDTSSADDDRDDDKKTGDDTHD